MESILKGETETRAFQISLVRYLPTSMVLLRLPSGNRQMKCNIHISEILDYERISDMYIRDTSGKLKLKPFPQSPSLMPSPSILLGFATRLSILLVNRMPPAALTSVARKFPYTYK